MNFPLLNSLRAALLGAVIVVLIGCTTNQVIPGASPTLLGFLRDGSTTRVEVVLQLGQPSSTLLDESVLTYRIGEDPKQGRFVVGRNANAAWRWEDVRYSLVLVFDERGVLTRHNLVSVQ